MKSKILAAIMLFIVPSTLNAQMNIEQTVQYINKTLSEYKGAINVSCYRGTQGISLTRYKADITIKGTIRDDVINFDIRHVKIKKSQDYHSFFEIIGDNNIQIQNTLKSSFSIICGNTVLANRLYNAFIHMQDIISTSYISPASKDPFDYSTEHFYTPKLDIQNFEFIDQNNNMRIDNNEQVLLSFDIINSGKGKADNVKIEINDKNATKGLSFQKQYSIASILANQKVEVKIPINANSDLSIGQAELDVHILLANEQVAHSTFSITTFNSLGSNYIVSKLPDIDANIPKTTKNRKNTYAIIIGNEDYKSKQPSLSIESNVKFAVNDARIFTEYLINTFGVPSTNITYLVNATSAEIKQSINKLKQLPIINPYAEIIFFYAGHGLPNDKTKEQYLIPVDVNSSNISYGININELISELSFNNPRKIIIILDACFSGAAREESLLSNRAVRVRPKKNTIKGNTIILSSSSNEEPSKAYDEMQHGMFTYFLLKKIQKTKGDIDIQSLYDYLNFNVREKSLLINNQIQSPTITKSPEIVTPLNEIKF